MTLTLEQRVEAERIRAKLDERSYIRGLIEAGRRGERPTAGLSAMNPEPTPAIEGCWVEQAFVAER